MPRKQSVENAQGMKGKVESLKGKWGGDDVSDGSSSCTWADVDPHLLFALITAVGNVRGAVMTGVDKQGVGLTLSVWLGGERVLNKWYNPAKGGLEALHTDIEAFLYDLTSD